MGKKKKSSFSCKLEDTGLSEVERQAYNAFTKCQFPTKQ